MALTRSARHRSLSVIIACLALGSCHQAALQDHGYAGTWVMTLNQDPFIVLMLQPRGDSFGGTLSWPQHWSTSTGVSFSEVTPLATTRSFSSVSLNGKALHLVIDNPKDRTDSDEFDLTLVDDDHASLAWTGYPYPPMSLVKVRNKMPSVSTTWNPKAVYRVELPPEAPDQEMAAIFDQDQKARQSLDLSAPQWASIEKDDARRRVRTRALLDSGRLKAGQDFRKAAFVFQHGTQPDDYLFAHTLALVALAKGDVEARWISTATLDRYLRAIGKPQIYGAGFQLKGDQVTAEEPFNRTLVSDDIRQALGVPPLAEQLNQFKATMQAVKKSSPGK